MHWCLFSLARYLVATPGAGAQEEPERSHTTEHFSITWVDDPSDPNAPNLTDNEARLTDNFDAKENLQPEISFDR